LKNPRRPEGVDRVQGEVAIWRGKASVAIVFTKTWARAVLLAFLAGAPLVRGEGAAASPHLAGSGHFGWARLITSRADWQRHARADRLLTAFVHRQTNLNIDPTWHAADPAKLEQLCTYPLVFVNDVRPVSEPASQKNLAEYLKRGGFMIVDACQGTEKEPTRFLREHIAFFRALLPEATIRELPENHALFSCYFELKDRPPHTWVYNAKVPELSAAWLGTRFNGVFLGDRMVALISLSALQCGWDGFGPPGGATESMKAIVNIYVFAMSP
jgi:hypothetical protein